MSGNKTSPFIYGTTVSDRSFTNREAETRKLQSNLINGINTTVISPRRWGKSSLVEKVIQDIRKRDKKTKTVFIDLFATGNETEFLETFAREVIKSSTDKWQEWLGSGKEFFKKLVPKLSLGLDPYTDFSLSFDWQELQQHSDEVLNLPEIIAKKKGIKFIICLDEFQNLSTFKNYEQLEKKMRAAWQRQKLTTYCLYGSKRHMMSDIFNNPAKPFYRFGDILLLPKIKTDDWISFIRKSFADTGKRIDEDTASLLPRLMNNHSWYVQQLAHYTWNNTRLKATRIDVERALRELIAANTPLYQHEAESLSQTQLNLLKAVADGATQLTGAATMQNYHLGTPRNVSKNKTLLIGQDIVQEVNGTYEFVDPAFEIWFRKQFLHQPFPL